MYPQVLEPVRAHLEALRKTPEGATLYALIQRGIERYRHNDGLAPGFASFMALLLQRYTADPNTDPATRFKVKLLQQRLTSALAAARRNGAGPYHVEPVAHSAEPAAAAPAAEPAPAPANEPEAPPPKAEAVAVAVAVAVAEAEAEPIPAPPAPEQSEKLEERLAQKVMDAVARSRELDGLLKHNLAALERADEAQDTQDARRELIATVRELMQEHQELNESLNSAHSYLRIMQLDKERLQQELKTLQHSSLVDDITKLPNRAALTRQLDAELARARRYGFSLVIALLRIQGIKEIAQRHGADTEEEIVRLYAAEILPQFRAHDLAARYDHATFAVLFPNSQKDGALRALEKARTRAGEIEVKHARHRLNLPGFTSVLVVCGASESAGALLRRLEAGLTLTSATEQTLVLD